MKQVPAVKLSIINITVRPPVMDSPDFIASCFKPAFQSSSTTVSSVNLQLIQ
jgi:hypothetical protein